MGLKRVGRLPQEVREANEIVRRFAKICRAQVRAGGYWSLENPAKSYIWDHVSVQRLMRT